MIRLTIVIEYQLCFFCAKGYRIFFNLYLLILQP